MPLCDTEDENNLLIISKGYDVGIWKCQIEVIARAMARSNGTCFKKSSEFMNRSPVFEILAPALPVFPLQKLPIREFLCQE